MSVKNTIRAIPAQGFNSAALNALVYQAINPAGLDQACFLLKISNLATTSIIISYDGVNDHDVVYINSVLQIYGGAGSSQPNNGCALWRKGSVIWVRGTAGVGTITLSGYYQPQGS